METLVAVAQHRNHGYSRSKAQLADRFGSSPSRGFSGINCRTFQSVNGSSPSSPPLFPSYAHTSESKSRVFKSEPPKLSRRSSTFAIIPKQSPKLFSFEEVACSELWAGPTYSISPPPSSLPIPKSFLPQKHGIPVDLPISRSKSAPVSPIRDSCPPSPDFFISPASATENLRRILNLDLTNCGLM